MSIFITGTGTDIGKTLIASWICLHTKTPYWKPVQTGEARDRTVVAQLAGVETYPETYHFPRAAAPYVAAKEKRQLVLPSAFTLPTIDTSLVIEGAGGVLVPLAPGYQMIDLIQQLDVPVLIVASSLLGTVNHTCLTVEALIQRGITVKGVILNGPYHPENKAMIEEFSGTPVLAEFPNLAQVDAQALRAVTLPRSLENVVTNARFVIASEARRSMVPPEELCVPRDGLPRAYSPRNDGLAIRSSA